MSISHSSIWRQNEIQYWSVKTNCKSVNDSLYFCVVEGKSMASPLLTKSPQTIKLQATRNNQMTHILQPHSCLHIPCETILMLPVASWVVKKGLSWLCYNSQQDSRYCRRSVHRWISRRLHSVVIFIETISYSLFTLQSPQRVRFVSIDSWFGVLCLNKISRSLWNHFNTCFLRLLRSLYRTFTVSASKKSRDSTSTHGWFCFVIFMIWSQHSYRLVWRTFWAHRCSRLGLWKQMPNFEFRTISYFDT